MSKVYDLAKPEHPFEIGDIVDIISIDPNTKFILDGISNNITKFYPKLKQYWGTNCYEIKGKVTTKSIDPNFENRYDSYKLRGKNNPEFIIDRVPAAFLRPSLDSELCTDLNDLLTTGTTFSVKSPIREAQEKAEREEKAALEQAALEKAEKRSTRSTRSTQRSTRTTSSKRKKQKEEKAAREKAEKERAASRKNRKREREAREKAEKEEQQEKNKKKQHEKKTKRSTCRCSNKRSSKSSRKRCSTSSKKKQ